MLKTDSLKIDYTRYYEKWHSDKPEHIQGMKQYYKGMLARFLPPEKNIRILEVGCGMGFALLALQDLGYPAVEGIDIDQGQIQSCLNKNLNVTHVEDSVEYLSNRSHAYDIIFAFDVVEHIPYNAQLSFVSAIYNALKPNGQFVCAVPNANAGIASRWRYNDWTHHISFTEHSLDFLLYNAGFEEIEIRATDSSRKTPGIRSFISRSILHKWFWKEVAQWLMFTTVRTFRRMEMMAELGWEEGKNVPLSLNIVAVATKR